MKTTYRTRALTLATALLAAIATAVHAQDAPPPPDPLLTQPGWEIGAQVSKYKYEEPDFIKLEGNQIGIVGAYTFTNEARVYNRIDLRVSYGKLDYESVGTGTSSDEPNWTGEVRAVIGRDYLVGGRIALSPYIGLGYRYLYNDGRGYTTTGHIGYRRYSQYWYAPIGLTMRMRAGAQWVFAPTVEYDAFIGGKQVTRLGDVAPGAPDITNDQDRGRGHRVYLMMEGRHWAFGPWFHYWKIKDSDIVPISATEGLLEPANTTREYGLELRYRF